MATLVLRDTSTPLGSPNNLSGVGWSPGRTICLYVNGQWAGAFPTGPAGNVASGAMSSLAFMPTNSSTGAAKPAVAKDNTDISISATDTVTLT